MTDPSRAAAPARDHSTAPAYRADIDGLRAVAILSVLVFHAFPHAMRGGFVGVDIFFVISGYLISGIIFRGLQRGGFSFVDFYGHRTRRIFPALLVVMAACYGVGWFVLLPDEFKQLGKYMAAGAGFVQNFVLWREAGYFDTASELKPLMHLWSLAVEEQFYLVYPVLVWALWRRGWALLLPLLAVVSFGLGIAGLRHDPVGSFFLPQTRFWELLAGGVLAYLQLFRPGAVDAVGRRLMPDGISVASLLLVLAACFGLHAGVPFPGWWALMPVAGAFGLILAGPQAWVNRRILANRWMVFVGTISYPLYLWHWPILSLARTVLAEPPSAAVRVGAVALSFLLAWLTYRLVERPVRFGRQHWAKTGGLALALALLGCLGWNTYLRDGFGFREKDQAIGALYRITDPYAYFDYRRLMRVGVCHSVPLAAAQANGCLRPAPYGVFLWGDSYAAALFTGMDAVARRRGEAYAVSQLTDGNGPPFFRADARTDEGKTLVQANTERLEAVRRLQPRVVLLAWMVAGRNGYADPATAVAALSETAQKIRDASPGTRVVVVGPVPEWNGSLQKQVINAYRRHRAVPPVYMAEGLNPAIPVWDRALRSALAARGIDYVSAVDAMCRPAGCLTRASGQLTDLSAVDWGHLSASGSVFLAQRIEAAVFGPPAAR